MEASSQQRFMLGVGREVKRHEWSNHRSRPLNIDLRKALVQAVLAERESSGIVSNIVLREDGSGTVTYNSAGVWIDPQAPGFSQGTTTISDEELVRAQLLVRLVFQLGYPADPQVLEIERTYKSVGRPGKGGRIDVLVRKKGRNGKPGEAFLFIECKAPNKFDSDLDLIDGQLFRLSRQEAPRPKTLVYHTTDLKTGHLRDRTILIDTDSFPDFEAWDKAGQPVVDTLPASYGRASKRRYANLDTDTDKFRSLDKAVSPETFSRLRSDIHDVIWGGGGTNNNDVFVYITKLILCKIFDEKETEPEHQYRFQRFGDAANPESASVLMGRINKLYREAEEAYLALPKPSQGPAFDATRISAEKIAYVVGKLESISLTENVHPGDLLGEFFEQIVSQDFTQTKGQFFTPPKIVRFMLYISRAVEEARNVMLHRKDHLGRPRLPYVIDPACGSGTFLIEYMKHIRNELGTREVGLSLPRRLRESHQGWFQGLAPNAWARDYLFGIENNYDLGISAKVNMVLHGDGSMNTWIASGLLPFTDYWIEGRHNLLGSTKPNDAGHPYRAKRNEQFDFIISNPPFSIRLSTDERTKVEQAFEGSVSFSENLFVERWYQLLREGGRMCCILPEAVLDTSTNVDARLFLLQHFRIEAIVSLPYDAFRPFTSTKTCIVLATKRSGAEVASWSREWAKSAKKATVRDRVHDVLVALEWDREEFFMGEPQQIGYKRRKNLTDLPLPNELYQEDERGLLRSSKTNGKQSVLDCFLAGKNGSRDARLGFWTSLGQVASRGGIRLDPKYRWLWDHESGLAHGNSAKAQEVRGILELVELRKVPKGDLDVERKLIDLDQVESCQALLADILPVVDTIGSDKVSFAGCELAFSKLEPYLGKIIIEPPEDAVGSTEWVGMRRKGGIPLIVLAYLLMLPGMREAYRRLQSGKRHARLTPEEILDLWVQVPDAAILAPLASEIESRRVRILEMRRQERLIRATIDDLYQDDTVIDAPLPTDRQPRRLPS
jgi:type I restriction-modification system DNA methylase subunit